MSGPFSNRLFPFFLTMAFVLSVAVLSEWKNEANLIAAEPIPFGAPEGEAIFDGYQLAVNGKTTPVFACRVSAWPINQTWPGYQRPLDQTELAGFARWEMSEKVLVEVVSRRDVEKVTIRPLSLGITPKVTGNRILFELDHPTPIVVEVNDFHEALHLFPTSPRSVPTEKNAPGLHYFGPGVHDIGVLNLQSGESVYLDAGAFVYGSLHAKNASDIRIEGPGVLDASRFERGEGGGCLKFIQCHNIHVDGPIFRDPDVWTVNVFDCDDVDIRNVSLIGLWRYNSDGIDVCNSRNILVEGAFVRSFDDGLVLKGLPSFHEKSNQNVAFRRCVVWCDWGRALEVGAETCAPEDANIIFEDCDVIRTTGVAMDVQHYDEAVVRDVRFENIRVEFDDWIPRELLQKEAGENYVVHRDDDYCSRLMVIVLPAYRASWSSDRHGTARNIVFKNIAVYAHRMPPSFFSGFDESHNVDGVLVEDVRIVGQPAGKDAQSLHLSIGPFVSGVTIR